MPKYEPKIQCRYQPAGHRPTSSSNSACAGCACRTGMKSIISQDLSSRSMNDQKVIYHREAEPLFDRSSLSRYLSWPPIAQPDRYLQHTPFPTTCTTVLHYDALTPSHLSVQGPSSLLVFYQALIIVIMSISGLGGRCDYQAFAQEWRALMTTETSFAQWLLVPHP